MFADSAMSLSKDSGSTDSGSTDEDSMFSFFLSSLKIDAATIERMQKDEITPEVIVNMSDSKLESYIKSYGTRIMVFGYCQRTYKTKSGTKKRKRGLLSMIKNKIYKNIADKDDKLESPTSECKKGRPFNKTRKIEIGWLIEDNDKKLKQVRLKTGGGTRFAQNKLAENITVGDMYDSTKLNLLRFYLATRIKSPLKLPRVTSTVTSVIQTSVESKPNVTTILPSNQPTETDILHEAISNVGIDFEDETNSYADDSGIISFNPRHQFNLEVDDFRFLEELESENTQQPPPESTKGIIIRLRMTNIMDDMIAAFKDREILINPISFERILSNGEIEVSVGSGVDRDTFSSFWTEFYDKYTVVIRHDMGVADWQAVARVIIKGFETCGYWPLNIAPPFLEEAMFATVVSDLNCVFFNHVSHSESEVLKLALNNFESVDKEELTDILATYDCRKLAKAENIKNLLTEISRKEIVQRPMFMIDSMRSVFVNEKAVIDFDEFMTIYSKLTPSTKNVLSVLHFPECMTDRQNIVANYLRRFIRGLDTNKLELFLRFCTGSDQNTEGDITVMFTEMSDFLKRPIARTCGKS